MENWPNRLESSPKIVMVEKNCLASSLLSVQFLRKRESQPWFSSSSPTLSRAWSHKNLISTTRWLIKGLESASTTFTAAFLLFVVVDATLTLEPALVGAV